jgi:hypothetical protein
MDEPFGLINAFEVPAGAEEDFTRGWEAERDHLQTQPGYIKTALHQAVSPDADFRFVNVGRPYMKSAKRRLPVLAGGERARVRRPCQSLPLFVDGVAGLALIAIGVVILRFIRPHDAQMAKLGFFAALGAAATSLVQFGLGITFTYDAAHNGSPRTVRDLFVALNNADTVKIVFLATMIAAVSVAARRTDVLPSWFAIYGFVTAPFLAISGLAFPFNNDALLASLELTLLLLLIWLGILSAQVARRSPRASASEAAPVPAT